MSSSRLMEHGLRADDSWRKLSVLLLAVVVLVDLVTAQQTGSDILLHDFDHDGVEEKLISRPGTNIILHFNTTTKTWAKADYTLPEGVSLVDESIKDAGLRFVDLNGDGFDDILFSNPQRHAVHLWSKQVRLDLGWARGWSQFVRAGERMGASNEPP